MLMPSIRCKVNYCQGFSLNHLYQMLVSIELITHNDYLVSLNSELY